MTTDADIVRGIAQGIIPSPFEFMGSTFFAMRFSGTGVAYRESVGEFVFRSPAIWLTDDMQRRVAGTPVIAEHPEKQTLDGDEFYNRIVGVVVAGFIKGTELWCVSRVIDQRAADIVRSGDFDTSPAVAFAPGAGNSMINTGNDKKLLIEGNPTLIDHLALIDMSRGNEGVWTKGGLAEPGISTTENQELNND